MPITLVAAVDYALAIGKKGVAPLPWHLRADLKHFQTLTEGGVVLVGKNTFESLPDSFKPLPHRQNWIMTTDLRYQPPKGCWVARNVTQVLLHAERREVFVIGGSQIYQLFHEHATRMVVTHVETELPEADAFFPELPKEWVQTKLFEHVQDERNDFRFTIVEYRKPQHAAEPGRQ